MYGRELDRKGKALKNWCFRTVVLGKTPESPLDRKEIKPVNCKGNQLRIFIGRIDAEAAYFGHLMQRTDPGKDPDAGKDWGQHKKATTEDELDPQLLVCDVVQLLNCVQLFAAPWTAACQATLFFTISWSLLTLVFIESVMLSHHLTFCYPLLLLPCLSHHQSRLWWWVGCSHQVAKVLELYLQHQSFQVLPMNVQDWFPLGLSGLILLSKGLSRVFYSTAIWKHQFLGAQPSLWSNSHICTWLLEKP